ncbi:Hsp20/alpha crystallin family protein [Niallia sp. Krafla_26]|uniref:Hsp20/alpha crystallin family protein n=1 Tax=Niallia sp. Krafla_26 TaxID=3064703 RepID=UPI003D1670D4
MLDKQDKPLDLKVVEEWLENYFLDPLTSYLDETVFRIDLFETADEYIIEALLPEIDKNHILIKIEVDTILIDIDGDHVQKQRSISFPFNVSYHDVKATFENGILEVFISKQRIENGLNRIISI